MSVELKHILRDEDALRKYALVELTNDTVNITVRLPIKGEFSLGLFACKREHSQVKNVCNYLVSCTEASKMTPFPLFNDGMIGEGTFSDVFDVRTITHSQDIILTNEKTFEVRMFGKSNTRWVY